MNRRTRLVAAVTVAALFVAGCTGPCSKIDKITAPAPGSGSANFATYVAMGTSIGAGFESNALVFRHQEHAYPALFAKQVGAAYTYPAISDSGLSFTLEGPQAILQLSSLVGPVILPGQHVGSPTNSDLPTPYTNMSVPGALILNVADTTLYNRNPWFDVIQRRHGPILQQVVSLAPTFVSFEYGANEVLGPATAGSGTPVIDAATFAGVLTLTLNALQAQLPNTKLALFTVPDVTSIPFVTTIPPVVVDPATREPVLIGGHTVPLLGPGDQPLAANDFVLLPAAGLMARGIGIPAALGGTGIGLPDSVVLSHDEAVSIRAAVTQYNAAIVSEAATRGAALVDLHGLLIQVATTGVEVNGVRYTSAFLTGGMFSLDGVHPTDLAHGLIANLMIDAVNAKFGASIPRVDLTSAATASASRLRPALAAGAAEPMRVEGLEALRSLFPRR